MRILDILTKAGTTALNVAFPGSGSLIAGAINAFLPDDKKISASNTGTEIGDAIDSLPAENRSMIYEKQIDLEIEEVKSFTQVMQALAQADSTGNTTRPKIALMMAWVVCYVAIGFSTIVMISILLKDDKTLSVVKDCWPLVLAIIGTPTSLLGYYFGKRSKDKERRYQMATGSVQPDLISKIVGLLK